jgi:hypothetical protein
MGSSLSPRCLLRAAAPTARRARVPQTAAPVAPTARPARSAPLSTSSRGTRGGFVRARVVPVDLGFPPPDLAFLPTPSQVFDLENVAIFPFWGAMMFAPDNSATKAVMSSYLVPFLTGAVYVYLVWFSFHDPRILESFSTGKPDLEALAKGFSYEWCMAVGWAHFIAMDLFVGRWVYLDAQKNRVFAIHSLLLTLFFGPTGAVSHVLTRGVTGLIRGEKLNDVMLPAEEK